MKKIGITTTVPSEVLIAAGYEVIDINNIFITSDKYNEYIEIAEKDGFPKSLCAWIKGMYGVCMKENIKEIVGVMEGDCSNTKALLEVLELKGVKIYPFSYPNTHKYEDVKKEMNKFMDIFNVSLKEVELVRERANKVRKLVRKLDEFTYIDGKVNGFENHLYQVSVSDFEGSIEEYEEKLCKFIEQVKYRKENKRKLRLGYIGVPPMTGDIYEFVEGLDSQIIYNEVQREFAFPRVEEAKDIYYQYYDYTYPYDVHVRLDEIKKQLELRQLDGIIHYTQSFCYRAVQDIVIKEKLNIPILNIEGDKLNKLDARTKLRIEAFIDMLHDRKEGIV